MKLSKSEAGKIGYQKAKIIFDQLNKNRRNEYSKNPTCCLNCGKELDFKHHRRRFCSTSCSNIYRSSKNKSVCLNCGNILKKKNGKYCSTKCQFLYKRKLRWDEWEAKGEFPMHSYQNGEYKEISRPDVKKYLEYKYGHKCSICELSEWLGKPILLIVDHVDGDMKNNKISNYRLICSNCDSTLETYKGRNKKKKQRIYRNKYSQS